MKHADMGFRPVEHLDTAEGLRLLNAQLRAIWAMVSELLRRLEAMEREESGG